MKSILVTGASTGIGEACALHFARMGHHVYAGVRNEADGERLRAATSGLVPIALDVTDQAQLDGEGAVHAQDRTSARVARSRGRSHRSPGAGRIGYAGEHAVADDRRGESEGQDGESGTAVM